MPRVCLDPAKTAERRFSDWVRGELIRQKKSQVDLARELCVSAVSISNLLNGKVLWKYRDAVKAVLFLDGDLAEVLGNFK